MFCILEQHHLPRWGNWLVRRKGYLCLPTPCSLGCGKDMERCCICGASCLPISVLCRTRSSVAQSCPTLCSPVDCRMPSFPVTNWSLLKLIHTVLLWNGTFLATEKSDLIDLLIWRVIGNVLLLSEWLRADTQCRGIHLWAGNLR